MNHEQWLTRIIKTKNVILEVRASGSNHHLACKMLADLVADLTCLQCKLSCWYHDQTYNSTELFHFLNRSTPLDAKIHAVSTTKLKLCTDITSNDVKLLLLNFFLWKRTLNSSLDSTCFTNDKFLNTTTHGPTLLVYNNGNISWNCVMGPCVADFNIFCTKAFAGWLNTCVTGFTSTLRKISGMSIRMSSVPNSF